MNQISSFGTVVSGIILEVYVALADSEENPFHGYSLKIQRCVNVQSL